MQSYDHIIVGAGSAGCVLANRLGADRSRRILVVEAGPMDRDLMIHVPAGVYRAWRDPRLNWNYLTEAEAALDDRRIVTPRGRVVGGSSSINSMVYMRGHPRDYDGWEAEHGLAGWSYADCLPYFRAGETYAGGADAWRGGDGPLGTCKGSYDNPLYDAFIAAGGDAGQGQTDDPNGASPEGVARLDATKRNGRRCSAAVAHLRPALKRGNVTLVTRAQVARLLFDGDRACGVAYTHRRRRHEARAGEVILSGGAINSPQLLMLSGIGPADHLRDMGIGVRTDLPGVGRNLMDHPCIILQWECLKGFPIHRVDHPLRKAAAGAWWVFTRGGVAASNVWEAGGLIRGNDGVAYANLQYHFAPVGFEFTGNRMSLSQAFAIHVDVLRPEARGEVRLASADPGAKPQIIQNLLTQRADMRQMVEGVRKARDLVAQPAFDGLRGRALDPGPDVQSDAEIAAWIRGNCETDFHPCGTCRMGHGAEAVVDPSFRVRGVTGLRVVDASVFPQIISANLNAPTQMIAARAADMIRGATPLAPERPGLAFESDGTG